jgi:hypothetical protein
LRDLDWTKRAWGPSRAYAESKLHVVALAFTPARRWPEVLSNAVDPGWARTRMGGPVFPCFRNWIVVTLVTNRLGIMHIVHLFEMTVARVYLEEIAMAKTEKRVAVRKKSSKRGKATAKPARKVAAKHATPKKAKSKVQHAGMRTKKPAPKKKQTLEPVETRQVAAMPVATIEEPAPGMVAVSEHESVQLTPSISTDVQPEVGEDIGPAGSSQ